MLLGLAMPRPVFGQMHDVTASIVLIPSADIAARLAEKLPEWEALDMVPGERFSEVRPIIDSALIACVFVYGLKLSQELIHRLID